MRRNDGQDGRSGVGTARRQRLAAALRENLAKRKAQSRARESTAAVADSAHAAAGEAPAADGDPEGDSGDDPPARGC